MFRLRRRGPARAEAGIRSLFHGVAVESRDGCACAAVLSIEAERFISDEAPALPLASCDDPAACRCVYRHFDDRRQGARREVDLGLPPRDWPADARSGAGRRITDC